MDNSTISDAGSGGRPNLRLTSMVPGGARRQENTDAARPADSVVHNALRNGFGWVMLYGGIGVWIMAAISFVSFNARPGRTEVQCPD
ncbi:MULTISPECIES: hypothetical protein [unclassified Mesorhizobium]|uniref:hypothetical protein n=1 Tax=unclassified Mesorhizobium TaxID=325217 RepID=UPI0015CDFBF0|nr:MULTISPECIES: hypothetical protein [unclassified Mesorhizobium]